LSVLSSRLGFVEKRLISWESVLESHQVRQNPLHGQQIALSC
jgi:hypothetical protein